MVLDPNTNGAHSETFMTIGTSVRIGVGPAALDKGGALRCLKWRWRCDHDRACLDCRGVLYEVHNLRVTGYCCTITVVMVSCSYCGSRRVTICTVLGLAGASAFAVAAKHIVGGTMNVSVDTTGAGIGFGIR